MSEQTWDDITGFRTWPWTMPFQDALAYIPEGTTCARLLVTPETDTASLFDRFERQLADRGNVYEALQSQGPPHRFDDLCTLTVDYPHLTWYEDLLGFPVRAELRFAAVARPVLSQAALLPKTVFEGFEDETMPKEYRQKKTKEFLETLCGRYETLYEILSQKYGRPRRKTYGDQERRYWESVWERPSGLVQLHLGGSCCPYDFWISYCPTKQSMIADEKAREAFRKL